MENNHTKTTHLILDQICVLLERIFPSPRLSFTLTIMSNKLNSIGARGWLTIQTCKTHSVPQGIFNQLFHPIDGRRHFLNLKLPSLYGWMNWFHNTLYRVGQTRLNAADIFVKLNTGSFYIIFS